MRTPFHELFEAMQERRRQIEEGYAPSDHALMRIRQELRQAMGCPHEEALYGLVDGQLRRTSMIRWLKVWLHVRVRHCQLCLEDVWGLVAAIRTTNTTESRPAQAQAWPLKPAWLGLTVVIVVSLALFFAAPEQPPQHLVEMTRDPAQITGGTYRRPLGNDPASLDPTKISDPNAAAVANQIFDGLVEFDSHLNVMPALAQLWSASQDGLVCKPRQDIRYTPVHFSRPY